MARTSVSRFHNGLTVQRSEKACRCNLLPITRGEHIPLPEDKLHASEKRITECLGDERRNEVFSVRYMARSDCEHPVKPRANITWKCLVYNSSKMLKGILDTLMHELITTLSIKNRECQLSSSKWLGNLVQNAGHFILPKEVPVLLEGIQRDDDDADDGEKEDTWCTCALCTCSGG